VSSPVSTPSAARPHRFVARLQPGVLLLDLAAPTHVFGHCGAPRYTFSIAGLQAGPVTTSTGFDVLAPRGLEALEDADTIVVPGTIDHHPAEACVAPLRAAAARGARIMSVCTGAFALAAAGLLDGRRATTHWDSCADLAERHPQVTVEPGVLYVDEGDVLTSAGVAAGIDLCLHVVRRDHGAELAAQIARRTVVAPHRDGGQAQFVRRPIDGGGPGEDAARAVAAGLEPTRAWALGRLREPLDVATMARHAHVSPRTFARRFREETGTTPAQWLLDQRTLAAQELLESTDLPVEEVAARSGFGSAASLRQHLARRARTTPTAYRRAFRTTGTEVVA
jgi:AraC family transcriptional activator FtrA